jgi:hypothetical protein
MYFDGDLNTTQSIIHKEMVDHAKSGKLTNTQILQQNFSNYYTISKIDGLSVYICSVIGCKKKFRCSWAMLRHVRTHTKEKLFTCRFCNYKSSRKDNLKVHEYKHISQIGNSDNCTATDQSSFTEIWCQEVKLTDLLDLKNSDFYPQEKVFVWLTVRHFNE